MNTKRTRDAVFTAHRYIGLAVGVLAAIIRLTGAALQFYRELRHAVLIYLILSILRIVIVDAINLS